MAVAKHNAAEIQTKCVQHLDKHRRAVKELRWCMPSWHATSCMGRFVMPSEHDAPHSPLPCPTTAPRTTFLPIAYLHWTLPVNGNGMPATAARCARCLHTPLPTYFYHYLLLPPPTPQIDMPLLDGSTAPRFCAARGVSTSVSVMRRGAGAGATRCGGSGPCRQLHGPAPAPVLVRAAVTA